MSTSRLQPTPLRQDGVALIYVIVLISMITLLLGTSVSYTVSSMKSGQSELTKAIQARNIARAGLQDANFWFSQQTTQPVKAGTPTASPSPGNYPDKAFYPRYNSDSTKSETDNESVGLVRDVSISRDDALMGHYEVRRQTTNNEPLAGGTLANNDPYAVHDISDIRTNNSGNQAKGAGTVWRITSYGYVYVRRDFTKGSDGVFTVGYSTAPNQLVDKMAAQVELQRLNIFACSGTPAAICYDKGTLNVGTGGRVINQSGTAIAWGGTATKPSPSPLPTSQVQGTSTQTNVPTIDLSPSTVFSVSQTELEGLADQSVKARSELKTPLPTMGIIFVQGDITFDSTFPLSGGGILYVTGNLTLSQDGNSSYSGVIYVGGNLTVNGANFLSGTVMVRGNTTISASSDIAEVDYSAAIIQIVRTRLGNYRPNNLTFKLIPVS